MLRTIICHRGVDRKNENSLESISAISSCYKEKSSNSTPIHCGVEFDIQMISDGTIICYHDDTLERLHNKSDKVYVLTADHMNELGITLFEDLIEKLSNNINISREMNNTLFDVEFKIFDLSDDQVKLMCDKVLYICYRYEFLSKCLFSSFDKRVIDYLSHQKYVSLTQYASINFAYIIYNEYEESDVIHMYNKGMRSIVINKELSNITFFFEHFATYVYTFFDINDEDNLDYKRDEDIIYDIIDKCAGFITDDYDRMHNILVKKIYI